MAASRGGIAVFFRKKKQDFFDENREADCACCRHGNGKEESPACLLGLSHEPGENCRKFEYDPLKRQPAAMPPLKSFDPNDFKL